ncbi:MAG: metallophosphoesterase [Bacillota bacterium]|nr:metallophosphoesterase [Bacillota bacterium]
MKILHTADIHLTEHAAERWEALDYIVEAACAENVDVLAISGDLFDHNVEAEKLRNKLRSYLSRGDFETIILPGNHDFNAYSSGFYFGDKVRVIRNPFEPVSLGELVIWGLPFKAISGDRLVRDLHHLGEKMDPDHFNILLYHGELLDAFFSRNDLGDEGNNRYMPVKLAYFNKLPVKYVLAGHFHSRYAGWNLPGGGLFIYPGSPVAVTRRESGRRVVNLIDGNKAPVELGLDSMHFQELLLELDPFSQKNPLESLADEIADVHQAARVILKISGFFNSAEIGLTESDLSVEIREKLSGLNVDEIVEDYIDISRILEDDLYLRFKERMEKSDNPAEIKEQALRMVIDAFRVVKSCS